MCCKQKGFKIYQKSKTVKKDIKNIKAMKNWKFYTSVGEYKIVQILWKAPLCILSNKYINNNKIINNNELQNEPKFTPDMYENNQKHS